MKFAVPIQDIHSTPNSPSGLPPRTRYRSSRRIAAMISVKPGFGIRYGMYSIHTSRNEVLLKEIKNEGVVRVGKLRRSAPIEIKLPSSHVSPMPIQVRTKISGMERPAGWYGEDSEEITSQACKAAIEFADRAMDSIPGLKAPRVGPSLSGAVGLHWKLGDHSLVVRVPSSNPSWLHFQEEGPDFHQEEGEATFDQVLARLAAVRNKARQS